ncbi:MAG: InlB B-repeat-containing protein [Eggerthellaceae bacterium]|nr:InlB B-repeat-containing protein [Eggerthellaceae bacterium]
MRRRLLGILLAVVLAVGMIPAAALTAFAEEGTGSEGGDPAAEVIARDGTSGMKYDTFDCALAAAQDSSGSTLKLLKGITLSTNTIIDSGTFTIDLNGNQITIEGAGSAINVVNNERGSAAHVTFADNRGGGGITSNVEDTVVAIAVHGGTAIFTGGNYRSTYYVPVKVLSGTVEIKGGAFEGNQRVVDNSGGTLTVEGGTFKANAVNGNTISSSSNTTIKYGSFNGRVVYHKGKLVFLGEGWSDAELCYTKTDGSSVALGEDTISLPPGYVALDSNKKVVNVLFKGTYSIGKIPAYAVNVDDAITNGAVAADLASAVAGATVTLTATPDAGYELDVITVKDAGGEGVTVNDGKFTMPASNVTVGATFKAVSYTISYDLAGGRVEGANPFGYTIESEEIALINPTRAGYTFAGWTGTGLNAAAISVTIPSGSTGDRSYTATWTPNANTKYVINHHFQKIEDDGYAAPEAQNASGTTNALTEAEAKALTGFTAQSFEQESIAADGTTVVDIYYTRNVYKLAFCKESGGDCVTTSVKYGAHVAAPADFEKTGYTFNGWDGELPATMPARDVTVTATWTINQYTITFDTDGGTAITPITGDYGTAITAPADPTREGYTFAGWDKEIPATMPAEDVTITAKWNSNYVPAPTYSPVIEDAKGGEVGVSTPNPSAGDKVTVSAKPAIGFEIGDVTVTDKDGNPVEVTVNEDGTFSFIQPSGEVNVEVSFALAGSGCQGDDGCVISGFSDAGTGSWYHEGVCWALNSGILRGYDNGLLGPANVTTRAQLFAMLHRLEGEPEVTADSTFADVDAGAWYAGSITWAQQVGLALGYGDGSEIGPNDPLTREQLATILYRYAQWKGMDVSASADLGSFADGSDVSSYAAPAVEWAVSEGVIRGYDDGSDEIGSKDSAQRGQVATMLMRFVAL